MPRVSVQPNDKAADAGFNQTTLGMAVAQQVRGTQVTKAIMGDSERDVYITAADPATTVDQLKNLVLGPVKLGDIADVKLVPGPVSMTRIDGARSATITAKPVGDNTGKVSTDLQAKIKELKLPLRCHRLHRRRLLGPVGRVQEPGPGACWRRSRSSSCSWSRRSSP